jgi:hypothetical protein
VGGAPYRDCWVTENPITEAIADALKEWKPQQRQIETGRRAGELQPLTKAELRSQILQAVNTEISRMRTTAVPDFFGREAIRKTRADAREIMKAIDQLKSKLSAKTLSPELRIRLGLHTSLIGSPSDLANMPVPRLLGGMEEVRGICQTANNNQPAADQVKLWCVRIALRLVLDYSIKRPSVGSSNSAFCVVAGLLYQSATGSKRQLRRICQEVLKPYQPLLPK